MKLNDKNRRSNNFQGVAGVIVILLCSRIIRLISGLIERLGQGIRGFGTGSRRFCRSASGLMAKRTTA